MNERPLIADHDEMKLTYGKYFAGFLASVTLTAVAYVLAVHGKASTGVLELLLAMLAITQFVVQMLLFLHVGEERGPRVKLVAVGFMLGVVLILVFGSLWIMNNLNYRMTPQQVKDYLKSQDNL